MTIPTFPGTNFDPVIEAYAKGNAVNLPALVCFDFKSGRELLWGGHYDMTAGGLSWKGLGRSGILTGIDGLEASSTMQSSDMTFSMSGVDSTTLTVFSDVDRSEYINRLCAVYMQFCDANWQPIVDCPPFALAVGIMGTASVNRVPTQDGKGWTRSISLPASNIFFGRSSARNSYCTDRDQQTRHPGDLFYSLVQSFQETSIVQPWR